MPDYVDDPEFTKAVHAVESNLDTGVHEAVGVHEAAHAVIWRARGQDIGEVVNEDDRVVTVISPPRLLDEDDIFALMAPEVFMEINGIPFTDQSVSSDREAIDTLFGNWVNIEGRTVNNEQNKKLFRRELLPVLSCPYIVEAIAVLATALDDIEKIASMSGERIHQIIDPILPNSPYAHRLRERLNQ